MKPGDTIKTGDTVWILHAPSAGGSTDLIAWTTNNTRAPFPIRQAFIEIREGIWLERKAAGYSAVAMRDEQYQTGFTLRAVTDGDIFTSKPEAERCLALHALGSGP